MTHNRLAVVAGTLEEVAGRARAALSEAGAVELERGRVARVDREKLTRFVSLS
ncbi:MAG: hypothetical protein ACLPYS_09220 [Vulcanimicrobiaceae bacterium]|jgi:hypothetical protein